MSDLYGFVLNNKVVVGKKILLKEYCFFCCLIEERRRVVRFVEKGGERGLREEVVGEESR